MRGDGILEGEDMNYSPARAVVVAPGTNDRDEPDIEAAARTVLTGIRKAQPKAPIFLVTPWDTQALRPIDAKTAAVRDTLRRVAREVDGLIVLDVTGVPFEQKDYHPTAAGHTTLAKWLREQILARAN